MSEHIEHIMIEIFKGLDLLGPADPASTSRALSHVRLPPDAAVVDVGCGTGRQTLQLLQETEACITATDLNQPMLDRLASHAARLDLQGRLRIRQADMAALPFAPSSLDLIWCEGAIYNMGYEQGLRAWRSLLRPGAYLCLSEAVYFLEDPPREVRDFWESEYPGISTRETLERIARDCGYAVLDSFPMPASAWEVFYAPVEARLGELDVTYRDNADGQQVLAVMRHEIDLFRRHGDSYGYHFLVLQKPEA
jgi:SAM-dependent methyltransferase